MFHRNEIGKRTGALAGIMAAACLSFGGAASAAPDMSGHPRMHMEGRGHPDMMGHGVQNLRPHNAADHFLKMAESLKLSADQIKQLTKMRDDYIEKYASTEDQLKAAFDDLERALFAADVDMKIVTPLLEKIGKLDAQLWPAFAQQLHDIKALLSRDQKKALGEMWHHREMGEAHREGPMR